MRCRELCFGLQRSQESLQFVSGGKIYARLCESAPFALWIQTVTPKFV
jgi:hypothetical protein